MNLASSELQGASCFGGGVLFWCRSRPCFPARVNFSPGSHHPSHTQPWKVWNCSFISEFLIWHDIVWIKIKDKNEIFCCKTLFSNFTFVRILLWNIGDHQLQITPKILSQMGWKRGPGFPVSGKGKVSPQFYCFHNPGYFLSSCSVAPLLSCLAAPTSWSHAQ